ncbi:hypothetical protein OPT61_g6171 [Boeremia exigua]|uniref:Uncharacterized protein n=1 Tax=Boeremia exigua TaxID=749465 RepID=A0ACC2I7L0_9PLEO|nr:hypothetical protein OPT61_g6171 [Boeremia exigua]
MAEITLNNSLREKMMNDEVAYTLSVKLVRSVELPMMAKTAGFDGILIDMEHSSFDLDTTSQICIAALYAGIAPIVRVPSKDPFFVSRVLDGGALGVIVPHIRTVQDAKDVVAAAKFQPQGHRSSTNNLPHFQYRSLAAKKSNPVVNANTLVIPMVETLEAVDCVEELAALDGVDSLLIGTNDMTAEMGIPGDYENPRLTEVYEKTIAACKKHGKWVGIGGLHSRLDLVEKFCAMGARWVMAATDGPLLLGGATRRAEEMDQLSSRVKAATGSKLEQKNTVNGVNGVKNGLVDVKVDEIAVDCRVASKECIRRRQGSVVDASDAGGESYIEALKARIAFLKMRIDESAETHETEHEATEANLSATTPGQRQTPQEQHNVMHSTMQEASYLSLSAMAERTDRHRSIAEGLSFRSLLSAAVKSGRRNGHTLNEHNGETVKSSTSVDNFFSKGDTSTPYQAYVEYICSVYPYIEPAKLDTAFRNVTAEHIRSPVSIMENSSPPEHFVVSYLGLATGIMLLLGHERRQELADDMVECSLEALHYVLDVGDDIAAVQCLIALTICSLFLDKAGSTWHLLGLSMTRGVACGIHIARVSNFNSESSPTEHDRAFWALFLLDTHVSSALDRPFYLEDADFATPENLPNETNPSHLVTQARMMRAIRQIEKGEALSTFISLKHLHQAIASRCTFKETDCARGYSSGLVELFKYTSITDISCQTMIVTETTEAFNAFLALLEDQLISRASAPNSLDGMLVFAIGCITCRLHGTVPVTKQQTIYQAINVLTLLSTRYNYTRGLRDILMELMMSIGGAEQQQPSARLRELVDKLESQLPSRIEMLVLGKQAS